MCNIIPIFIVLMIVRNCEDKMLHKLHDQTEILHIEKYVKNHCLDVLGSAILKLKLKWTINNYFANY